MVFHVDPKKLDETPWKEHKTAIKMKHPWDVLKNKEGKFEQIPVTKQRNTLK